MRLLDRLRQQRRPDDPYRKVFVVFTLPEAVVERLDISRGPCLPKPGNKRPMVGITRQESGDPAMFESLAAVLLGRTDAAWQRLVDRPPGRLATFSVTFVEAMAELVREGLRRQASRPRDFPWIFEPDRLVLSRWMPGLAWDTASSTVPPEATLLAVTCAWARISLERKQPLYCWSGPGFNPWVTAERLDRLTARLVHDEAKRQIR